jgi:hypothetical protein
VRVVGTVCTEVLSFETGRTSDANRPERASVR